MGAKIFEAAVERLELRRIILLSGNFFGSFGLASQCEGDFLIPSHHPKRDLTSSVSGQYPVQIMKAITYTAARENFASTMNKVCRNRAPIIITRNRDQSVVMLSLDDYEQLEETAYLLRSPTNARRLLSAIGSLQKGKGRARKIDLES